MCTINIGLLDFGYRSNNLNSMLKLYDMIDYAIRGEELGFDKFWIGEHHMPKRALPYNNPLNLIPLLAQRTRHIQVGSAGTLISIHNPYHIASTFKFYNNVYRGRIELGFANGTPYEGVSLHSTGMSTAQAVEQYADKIRQTIRYLKQEEEMYKVDGLVLPPYKGLLPEVWMLSSSQRSIDLALESGANLAFWVGKESREQESERLSAFKDKFFERFNKYPKIRGVIFGICHVSEKKARNAARSSNKKPEELLCGDSLIYQDFFQKIRDVYKIRDFMFFSAAHDPKDRLIGLEMVSRLLHDSRAKHTGKARSKELVL